MKNIFAVFAACLLAILSIPYTKAATRNWIGGTSSDFSVASNWHEGAVPVAGDVVQIGVTYSPTINTPVLGTSPNGGLNIYPNPAKTSITVTLTTSSTVAQVATADIYNTSGTLIEHKAVTSNSFTHDVSAYQLGVYIIELKNSNGVLVGKSKFVKVN